MRLFLGSLTFAVVCGSILFASAQEASAPKLSPPESRKGYEPRTSIRTVVLRVEVDRDGNPVSVSVARSLSKKLDKEAVQAVRKWKFEPAKKDGQTVKVLILVEVNFHCEEPTGECQVVNNKDKSGVL